MSTPMTDSAAILRIASEFVGVPYRLHGLTPDGWDCRGCVAYCRRLLFGKAGPSLEGRLTPAETASMQGTAEAMERFVRDRIAEWRPVAAGPGAVVLLEFYGRAAHVGLLLDHNNFIHAMPGAETVINRLDDARWARRLRGVFDG